MRNPNEYNDDAYTKANIQTTRGIEALWEAGATLGNIEDDIRAALENVVDSDNTVKVTISVY